MLKRYPLRSTATLFGAVILIGITSVESQAQTPLGRGSAPPSVSLKQLTLPLEGITDPDMVKRRVASFRDAIRTVKSCDEVDAIATKLGAAVTTNDRLPLSALPPQLQPIIASLPIGTATPMFGEKDKYVRTLVVCARDPS